MIPNGGKSNITTSYWLLNCCNISLIFLEPNISLGFGGFGPAGRTLKFLIGVSQRFSAMVFVLELSSVLNPRSFLTLNVKWTVDRRKSASTSRTFFPSSAHTTAKFAAAVDFPSETPDEVIANTGEEERLKELVILEEGISTVEVNKQRKNLPIKIKEINIYDNDRDNGFTLAGNLVKYSVDMATRYGLNEKYAYDYVKPNIRQKKYK